MTEINIAKLKKKGQCKEFQHGPKNKLTLVHYHTREAQMKEKKGRTQTQRDSVHLSQLGFRILTAEMEMWCLNE